jgi:hypothetical protein
MEQWSWYALSIKGVILKSSGWERVRWRHLLLHDPNLMILLQQIQCSCQASGTLHFNLAADITYTAETLSFVNRKITLSVSPLFDDCNWWTSLAIFRPPEISCYGNSPKQLRGTGIFVLARRIICCCYPTIVITFIYLLCCYAHVHKEDYRWQHIRLASITN